MGVFPGVLVDFLIAGSRGQPSAAVMSLAFLYMNSHLFNDS